MPMLILPRNSIRTLQRTLVNRKAINKVVTFSTVQLVSMPKFCANLSFMFTEQPFQERYKLAKKAGFQAVESGFPVGLTKEEVVKAKTAAGIEQVLVNIFADVTKGDFGFSAIPGQVEAFKKSLEVTIDYAKALRAKKIHIMSGKVITPSAAHDAVYESNLRYAASILEKEQIMGLIEPINKYSVPDYYMNSYQRALSVIKSINSPNLKLMLDIFHLQQIQGDISHSIDALIPHVGHVQIAQVPNRNEPDTPGELNFKYIFHMLEKAGYDDWIGLEYKPATTAVAGLKWIEEFGYCL